MDSQRSELIERFYAAFSRRDVDGMLAVCHELATDEVRESWRKHR